MGQAKKPPPFYCPSCGQKHRASIDELLANPDSVMRTTCSGCSLGLSITLADDGSLLCRDASQVTEPGKDAAPAEDAGDQGNDQAAPSAKDDGAKDTPAKGRSPASKSPAKSPAKSQAKGGAPKSRSSKRGSVKSGAAKRGQAQGTATPKTTSGETQDGAVESKAAAPEAPTRGRSSRSDAKSESPSAAAAAKAAAEAEFSEGEHVGRYAIESVIGAGGTSIVYRAFDPTTNRSVALKILRTEMSDAMRERFVREIEVQANIRHQNIMPVFDRGELPDGRPFFTMELLYDPWTLQDIIDRRDAGTLARYTTLKPLMEIERMVQDVLIPVADGMYVANVENGVVHRDLKPGNVLVDGRTLRPYVIDFGICHVLERTGGFASKTVLPPTGDDAGIVGTPRFLAPEQVRGTIHARTDVWGLGALLHYVASGEPPIGPATSISRAELKRRIAALEKTKASAVAKGDESKVDLCDEKLSRLTDAGLRTIDDIFTDARDANYLPLPAETPGTLAAITQKAMASTPSDRYVNARQLSSELTAWLKGSKVRAVAEVGGGGVAAMDVARRAARRHAMTALWLVGGLGLGVALGLALGKSGQRGPSTRLADAKEDIEALRARLEPLDRLGEEGRLALLEQRHLYDALDAHAAHIDQRLAGEPGTDEVRAVRERLAFVRSRFQPPRFVLDVPDDVPLKAFCTLEGMRGDIAIKAGENRLAPGTYQLTLGEKGVLLPLHVPMVVRSPTEPHADREAAWTTIHLPIHPKDVPSGYVLVPGDQVRARDLPFQEASAKQAVSSFLLARREVTNGEYATFLRGLPAEERGERAPSTGIVVTGDEATVEVTSGADQHPVVGVRPEDARAYAAWRSERDGVSVRLPNEAEWALAAGGHLGYALPGGVAGERSDAELLEPLRPAGRHARDVSPYGANGMLGNAREMVEPAFKGAPEGAVVVKGAGVGDDPDQGAIYIFRLLEAGARHATTGFRLARAIAPRE